MNTIPCYDRFAPMKRFALLATIVLASVVSTGLIVHGGHAAKGGKAISRTAAASGAEQTAWLDLSAIAPSEYLR